MANIQKLVVIGFLLMVTLLSGIWLRTLGLARSSKSLSWLIHLFPY